MDAIWQNLRYLLIAGGVALAAKVCNGCVGAPFVEQVVGFMITGLTILWGNYVKAGTQAVPDAVANKPSIPTVSAATGALKTN
jgi:hypothetical protein